jgi:ABC transport system ATP-binding/permease protein
LEPTAGIIKRGTNLQVAYFDQQRDQLDPTRSIMDNVTGGSGDSVTIDGQPRHVSGYLRDFLFPPERLNAPITMLSGGERNRLLLARLFAKPSNLLIMDEPTNDLDAETLELLEEMVANYNGTLLLVSHDRAFLDNVVTSTLVFEGGGRVNEYVGGYTDWLNQPKIGAAGANAAKSSTGKTPASNSTTPLPSAVRKGRKLSFNEQRELAQLPQLIQRLEAEQLELQTWTSDPQAFSADRARAEAALKRLQTLTAELEASYVRWDELETASL